MSEKAAITAMFAAVINLLMIAAEQGAITALWTFGIGAVVVVVITCTVGELEDVVTLWDERWVTAVTSALVTGLQWALIDPLQAMGAAVGAAVITVVWEYGYKWAVAKEVL